MKDRFVARGRSIDLVGRAAVMAIVNCTPDSFYPDSRVDPEAAAERILAFVAEGAEIADVGGESTRPGFTPVPEEEEKARVVPAVAAARPRTGAMLSVDTVKPGVARAALEAGADLVNDVWGLSKRPELARLAAEYGAGVVVMHNSDAPVYPAGVLAHMEDFFKRGIQTALAAGVREESILLDPGIGFGKAHEQNVEVLRHLDRFARLGFPLLLALSRKSVVGHILQLPPEERLEGTIALNVAGALAGADIVRVHDVAAHRRALDAALAVHEKGALRG